MIFAEPSEYSETARNGESILQQDGIPATEDDLEVQPAVSPHLPEEVIEQRLEATPTAAFDSRASDEIWLISSRNLGSRNAPTESLDVRLRIQGNHWQSGSTANFFGPDPSGMNRPVVIFIHGNRWSIDKTIRRGLQTYDRTILPWKDAPPVRFVIWTWPSDAIPGPIRDVRIKAGKADQHAFHLARFLQRIDPNCQVSLIGFSFGGRLTLGALHLVGGGSVDGCGLGHSVAGYQPEMSRNRFNVALVVPAIRNDCMISVRSQAYHQINDLFLLYNSRDTYLGLYKFTRFDGKNPALGYTGICGLNHFPDHSYRVQQFNSSRAVGSEHDFLEYISDRRIEANLRKHILTPPQ
ncbi:alpha/beta hydrolase family protein [Aporhodopirellula aestuarii]|uniref:Alpha/beta hydrolase n=1 Tax=Aporhodopirellula aestuarii TaxID=2950107 RepID=A0ABT0U9S3_9BACT|nr:alpha/beta hydrolase [Aporhodopirellula aestuarii]MCM2373521.1 alpha/beta hydrolase [Aporhodopirellula aestuarii]